MLSLRRPDHLDGKPIQPAVGDEIGLHAAAMAEPSGSCRKTVHVAAMAETAGTFSQFLDQPQDLPKVSTEPSGRLTEPSRSFQTEIEDSRMALEASIVPSRSLQQRLEDFRTFPEPVGVRSGDVGARSLVEQTTSAATTEAVDNTDALVLTPISSWLTNEGEFFDELKTAYGTDPNFQSGRRPPTYQEDQGLWYVPAYFSPHGGVPISAQDTPSATAGTTVQRTTNVEWATACTSL